MIAKVTVIYQIPSNKQTIKRIQVTLFSFFFTLTKDLFQSSYLNIISRLNISHISSVQITLRLRHNNSLLLTLLVESVKYSETDDAN